MVYGVSKRQTEKRDDRGGAIMAMVFMILFLGPAPRLVYVYLTYRVGLKESTLAYRGIEDTGVLFMWEPWPNMSKRERGYDGGGVRQTTSMLFPAGSTTKAA